MAAIQSPEGAADPTAGDDGDVIHGETGDWLGTCDVTWYDDGWLSKHCVSDSCQQQTMVSLISRFQNSINDLLFAGILAK